MSHSHHTSQLQQSAQISVVAPGTLQSTTAGSISASGGAASLFPNTNKRGRNNNCPAELQMEDEEADENCAQHLDNNEEMITDQ